MKKLIITEKKSVATSIAKALYGKNYNKNSGGFYENTESIIAFASGHLVGLCSPDMYDERYKKWQLDTLPIMPKNIKYTATGKDLLNALKKQMNRPDVDELVCATDAGREGELILD